MPTLTGNTWINGLFILAAVVTALGVLWRKVLRPLIRFADVVQEAIPVLMEVAKEWRINSGGTVIDILRQSVADLTVTVRDLSEYSHAAKHEQANMLQRLVLQIDALQKVTALRNGDEGTRSTDPKDQ